MREAGGPTERQQGGGRRSSRAWAGGHRRFSTPNAAGGLTGEGGGAVADSLGETGLLRKSSFLCLMFFLFYNRVNHWGMVGDDGGVIR